jgi:hypothetical protein
MSLHMMAIMQNEGFDDYVVTGSTASIGTTSVVSGGR